MSGQQEIVEVYVKKERKPETSGGKGGKQKRNNNKNNEVSQDTNNNSYYKQQIIEKFNQQEKVNLERLEQQKFYEQTYTIEEEKQDFEVKIKKVQEIFGDQIGKKQIKNALRANNMNLDVTIDQLFQSESKAVKSGNNLNGSNGSGGNRLPSSSNSLSSDNTLHLRQLDSEEKEARLRLSQKSSDKESPMKYKLYAQKIQSIKAVIEEMRDEIIVEALELNNGEIDQTIDYLLQEGNIKSLEVCLQEQGKDLSEVDHHLEEIVEGIIEQGDIDLMMEIENNEEIDEFNVEEDLYLLNIKQSMSHEEQCDPLVQRFLKINAVYAKQLEILNEINEKNSSSSPQTDFKPVQLKKNNSQNIQFQLEQFKEDFIRTNHKKAKNQYIMKESEFPTIVKQQSGPQGNIVKTLQKGNKLEYNPNQNQWNVTVFQNEDISALGQQFLQDLSTKFPHVDRDVLVDIFKELSENYQATEQFLTKQFGKSNIKQEIKIIKKVPLKPKHSYYDDDNEEDEDQILEGQIRKFEKQYGIKSFKEIRAEIINAYKYNKAYQLAERNSDALARFNLHKYFQSNEMSLDQMKEYSKAICLREVRQQNPICKIDLHGFYADEALDILKDQIMYMKKLARDNRTNSLKIINKCIQLEIVTGRGSHSLGKISVLKPAVIKFLDMANYNFKADEGKIIARIPY